MAAHTHDAHGTHSKHRQGEAVVTAVDRQLRTAGQPQGRDLFRGAAGGLETHHVRAVHQPGHRRRGDAAAGAARDVVKHQRQLRCRFSDGPEMGLQTLLRRLVVVGHHNKSAVGAGRRRFLGGLHRFRCGIAARARQHLGVAAHGITNGLQQLQLLVPAEGRRFTGGAAHQQSIGSLIHKMPGQVCGNAEIHSTAGIKGGHHRGDHTAEGRWREGGGLGHHF